MTVHMKAKRGFVYAGRRLVAGQEFDATGQSDARVLTAIGRAEAYTPPPVVPDPAPAAGGYRSRAMEAKAEAPAEAPADKPKRTYTRRDMTAQGSEE